MITIGIYDSGIGGLTTTVKIMKQIHGIDFYYLADNKNMPFGTKSDDEIEEIVYKGIKKLEAHSDLTVLACNTASVTTTLTDVFKLLPSLDGLSCGNTLLMATPLTLSHLHDGIGFKCTDTKELASLIEIQASLCFKSGKPLSMNALNQYLRKKIYPYSNIENIVLGCSHYDYLKEELMQICKGVTFYDGNAKLIEELSRFIGVQPFKSPCVKFDFTGQNESEKYVYLLKSLLNGKI